MARVRAILREAMVATAAAVLVVAFGVLRLNFWHLRRPVILGADVGVVLEYVKNALQNGGTTIDPQIGYPDSGSLASFPVFDALSAGLLKVIALWTADPVTGANLLVYADHVLSAGVGYICFRVLRLPRVMALACAVSFADVEFALQIPRVFRHETLELFAPLAVGATIALLPLARPEAIRHRFTWLLVSLGSVIVGLSQPYWTAFSLLVLAPSAFGCATSSRWRAAWLLVGSAVVMLAAMVGSLLWPRMFGAPGLAIQRFAFEQPLYGLRLEDLLMPPRSALAWLNDVYARYLSVRGDINEGSDAFVGWPGLIGFAIAMAVVLGFPFRRRGDPSPIALASLLIFVLIAFTLRHGFGELFNTVVTPEIRAQNRASPMIAFLAIFVFAATLARYGSSRPQAYLAAQTAVVIVAAAGLWDQTVGLDYAAQQADPAVVQQWDAARTSASSVSQTLPAGATILQLPFMEFPEGAPIGLLGSYDEMNIAPFTKGFHYSFGSSGSSLFHSDLTPAASVIDAAAFGFDEVLFYRAASADEGVTIQKIIKDTLDERPNVDAPDFFGFDLRPLQEGLAPVDPAVLRIHADWDRQGFSPIEHGPDFTFRWIDSADARGSVLIDNPLAVAAPMRFCATVVPPASGAYQVTIDAAGQVMRPPVNPAGAPVDVAFDAPPGRSTLSVAIATPRLAAAGADMRESHVQLRSPRLEPAAVIDRARKIAQRAGVKAEAGCL